VNPSLIAVATGHEQSRFANDIAARADQIREAFSGRRVLVVGGAGSIGSATLRALLPYGPAAVHVVDHNENGLAELARDIRSAALAGPSLDLQLMPLDYGAHVTQRFLAQGGPYDAVLHFAALKHVRSEKDAASILQMIDTNVLKQARLMEWLAADAAPLRYFAVSTDKAANPANFMGASKRLMEQLLFTTSIVPMGSSARNSARFANVAFSAGSLLESWSERLRKRQPMAVPRDTRRYFVSLAESAEICLLAAAATPDRHLAIPNFNPGADLHELAPIAEAFVRDAGFAPVWFETEADARKAMEREPQRGAWPILLTARDTDGEKPEEVFAAAGEEVVDIGLRALRGIPQRGCDHATLREVLDTLVLWVTDPRLKVTKQALAECMVRAVPEFAPATAGKTLDARM
jgi:FlaA1/EpsC-like NDP-sugar epimerase